MSAHPIIQIAGILDEAEARMLAANGVHRLGFPLGLDVHREDLPPDEAAAVIRTLALGPRAWLITYLDDPAAIAALCGRLGCAGVQLHGGPIDDRRAARLRTLRPDLGVIKSLVVRDGNLPELQDRVSALAPHVDGFITDTFDPATGASGATGRTHDWAISRRLVELSPRPVILAGGLTPGKRRRGHRNGEARRGRRAYRRRGRDRPQGPRPGPGVRGKGGRGVRRPWRPARLMHPAVGRETRLRPAGGRRRESEWNWD